MTGGTERSQGIRHRARAGHRSLAAVVTAVLLAGLVGCGDDDPISRIAPTGQATPGAGSGNKAAGPAPVREPWRTGMREHGIAVYWENNPGDADGVVRAKAQKIFDHVVGTGANAVSLSFSFVMDGSKASSVRADDPMTPSPARLGIVLSEAKRRLLRVGVRPLLHEKNLAKDDPKAWRGAIAPADPNRWFDSYAAMLAPFAKVAQANGATTLVIGTELTSMERDKRWDRVAKAMRPHFRGELGYSANHDRLQGGFPARDVVKSVDAYPPLTVGDDASVAALVQGWKQWLDRGTDGPTPQLVLAEVAISARAGAYARPWSSAANGPIEPQIQERWFEAACQVMHDRDLAGIYFWMINLDADPRTAKPTQDAPMDFVGRPAERTVAKCFKRSARRDG